MKGIFFFKRKIKSLFNNFTALAVIYFLLVLLLWLMTDLSVTCWIHRPHVSIWSLLFYDLPWNLFSTLVYLSSAVHLIVLTYLCRDRILQMLVCYTCATSLRGRKSKCLKICRLEPIVVSMLSLKFIYYLLFRWWLVSGILVWSNSLIFTSGIYFSGVICFFRSPITNSLC